MRLSVTGSAYNLTKDLKTYRRLSKAVGFAVMVREVLQSKMSVSSGPGLITQRLRSMIFGGRFGGGAAEYLAKYKSTGDVAGNSGAGLVSVEQPSVPGCCALRA